MHRGKVGLLQRLDRQRLREHSHILQKGNINSTTGEALPSNFPVKIENSDGTQIQSIPTDANGEYSFCGLKAGTYTVCVDKPGWTADEPCVIVYLDCMDEEHDFDVYMGRSNILPGIEQPAITLGESTGAVVQGDRSGEPSEPTEQDIGGDEEEGRQPSTPE